jgi:hypothetical protein
MTDISGKPAGDRFKLAGGLLLAVLVFAGIIYSALLPPVARFTDEQEYLKLSANLVHGPGFSLDGVTLTAARAPGYAFFLAAIRLVGGDFISFRVAQFFLLGATVYLVARLCAGRTIVAGLLIVTLLVACYPVLFYTSATLYPQTLAGFLFIAALSFLLATPRGLALEIAAGVCFGALILVVPTFLFTMVVVLGAAGFLKIIPWRAAGLVVIAAALVVSTWTARNAIWLDHFVPVATNSGLNLLEGNNPQSSPEAAANVGMRPYYVQVGDLHLDEFQSDRYFRDAALSWMRDHPMQAFVLYLEKVANFFNVRNVYSSEAQPEVSRWKEIVMAASYILLLALLFWRLVDVRRFPLMPREKLFLIIYVLSAFTSAIFFTRIRHRLPYDYLIIAVIASNLSARLQARLAWAGRNRFDL